MITLLLLPLLGACGINLGFNLDLDDDNDGISSAEGDCNDNNASIKPNAEEIRFDGVDQNCNGMDDEDEDGDGQSVDESDCDDSAPYIFDGAVEFRDEVDNNCNETIDETNSLDGFASISNPSAYVSTGFSVVGGYLWNQETSSILVGETEATGEVDRSGLVRVYSEVESTNDQESVSTDYSSASILGGIENDRFGSALALGDLNGDSNLEIAVGVLGHDGDDTASGAVAVYSSNNVGGQTSYDSGLVYLYGAEAFSYAGAAIASGNVNVGDCDDLIIGAYGLNNSQGAVYLVYGKPEMSSGSLDEVADQVWLGENEDDRFGWALASGEDVDGDGHDDVLVGAPQNSTATLQSGAVYLLTGDNDGPGTTHAAAFYGESDFDQAGYSLALAPDVNGDGYADILVGAPGAAGMSQDDGRAYVVFGGNDLNGEMSLLFSDVRVSGTTTNQQFGLSVASLGDTNHDGFSDFAATGVVDDDLMGKGATYLFLGSDFFDGQQLTDDQANAVFVFAQAGTSFFVNGVFDVDGQDYESVGPYEDYSIVYGDTEAGKTLTSVLFGQATLE